MHPLDYSQFEKNLQEAGFHTAPKHQSPIEAAKRNIAVHGKLVVLGSDSSDRDKVVEEVIKAGNYDHVIRLSTTSESGKYGPEPGHDATKLFGDESNGYNGELSEPFRKSAADGAGRWVFVFNGMINPEWIELFNSVLDDNRLLCLPSHEQIRFRSERVHLIFNQHTLRNATPATVSRLSFVYVADNEPTNFVDSVKGQLEHFKKSNKAAHPRQSDLDLIHWWMALSFGASRYCAAINHPDVAKSWKQKPEEFDTVENFARNVL